MSHDCECHCTVVWIEVVGGGRFGRLDFLGRLRTDGGRRGYAVGDAAWGIGYVRPRAMDSCLMQ
jgi:hypothetical protein